MELTKCLLCLSTCWRKEYKNERYFGKDVNKGINSRDKKIIENRTTDDPIKNQLQVIFLLRTILEIPQDKCCNFLQDFGDPCSWIDCCDSCSILVLKAKSIFEQIVILQNQFEQLQNEMRSKIIQSVKCERTEDTEFKWGVKETVRLFVTKGVPDSVSPLIKEEDVEYFAYLDLTANTEAADSCSVSSLHSDSVHNQSIMKDESSIHQNDLYYVETDESNYQEYDPLQLNEADDANPNSTETETQSQFLNEKALKGEHDLHLDSSNNMDIISPSHRNITEQFEDESVSVKISNRKTLKAGKIQTRGNLCRKKFKNSTKLRECTKRAYKCEFCEKTFLILNHLKVHERIHSKEKLNKCIICEKTFSSSSYLRKHEKVHNGEKPYKCKFCEKCFKTANDLHSHEQIHTGKKRYQCKHCEKYFPVIVALKIHEKIHGEKSHKCKFCGKSFHSTSNLHSHEKTHTGNKPFKCEICGKKFGRAEVLKYHINTHTGEKPYACDVCTKVFYHPGNCEQHKRIHWKKCYKCKFCGKFFSNLASLTAHEKRLHRKNLQK